MGGRPAGDIPDLLEREEERGRIESALDEACDGRGATLLVEGPAGIGKTALLDHAAALATDRLTVLAARPTELEREFAFGTVRQLLEPALRAAGPARREALLAGPGRHAAPALGLGEPREAGDPSGGFAALAGLHRIVAELGAEGPLLLSVDDAHWADPDSIRFLSYLAPRIGELPALLIASVRPEEWHPAAALEATASDAAPHALEPGPLSVTATAELLERLLGATAETDFAAACHLATGGNPFYLRALAAELGRAGIAPSARNAERVHGLTPRAVTRTTLARLPLLSPTAPAVAGAVAVLGEDATVERVARLAGIAAEDARATADQLVEAAILEPAVPLRFAHPIVRAAIGADLPPALRAELHRRSAAMLLADGHAPSRIAPHLLAVEPSGDAATVAGLRRAAADALARGAPESAVAYLRRALAEPPGTAERAGVLLELGSAEALVEGPASIEHLGEALELAGGGTERASVAWALARNLIFADRAIEGARVAEAAIGELGDDHGELRRSLEATVLAVANTEPGLGGLRRSLIDRLAGRPDLDAGDPGARALAVGMAGVDAYACVPAADVVPRVERALADGKLLEADNGGAHVVAAVLVLTIADSELALPVLDRGVEIARDRGDRVAWAANRLLACLAHLARGELAPGLVAGTEGFAASTERGAAIGRPWGAWALSAAQLDSGDIDAAERTLADAGAPAEVPFNTIWAPFVDARSRVRLARGDLGGALADSLWYGSLLEALDAPNPALGPWRSRAALCLARLGDDEPRAHELVETEVDLARRWGAPRTLGAALRGRGLVRGGQAGIESLREAVEVVAHSPARLEHARSLVELGAALRRAGRRRECREPLGAGMDLAATCGARGLAERARAELRATGARPRRLMTTGVESLTPSEDRVVRLAAGGLTNREVAGELHLTRKTVESHLRQAYRKLEIGSREELPDALDRKPSGSAREKFSVPS